MKYEKKKPLTNYDILNLASEIKNFRGVFMRDTLPKKTNKSECSIVNLDSNENPGTHWVCYFKNKNEKYYFDSFGLYPPIELQKYLGKNIIRSSFQVQEFNTNYCGYLCLHVLSCLSKGFNYESVIFNLFNTFSSYINEHKN